MYGDRCISKQSFRTCSCDLKETFCSYDRVLDVPEMSCLLAVFDLRVGEGGSAVRTPVDDAVAAVDQPFFIEVDEDLLDCAGAAFVHREALARPVAGRAQLL